MKASSATALYAVIGHPVGHSLSPLMHNRAFAHRGIDAVYLAFDVKDVAAAVAGIRALGIRGVSVTVPHKISIMAHLDAIDPEAAGIGAVNTIICRDGRLLGKNSDSAGAMDALAEATEIADRRVAVIGAGGAARAVAYGVRHRGGRLRILNRSTDRGRALAEEFEGEFQPLSEADLRDCRVLINTTPIGMRPQTEAIPIPADRLHPGLVVMDIVYTPLKTRLLALAEARGCTTVDGLAMFIGQGARQFEWWTGGPAPIRVMTEAVRDALEKKE